MTHRLEQIVDALMETIDKLKEDTATSGFPIKAFFTDKRYIHWTELDILSKRLRRPVFPALLLNIGAGQEGDRREGGVNAKFASLGETEDRQPFRLICLLKESPDAPDPITEQVSNLIYSVERLINGAHDLGVEGVQEVWIPELPQTTEGRAAAESGERFEIVFFTIVVTHIYRSTRFE